jgi:hypothetical protein
MVTLVTIQEQRGGGPFMERLRQRKVVAAVASAAAVVALVPAGAAGKISPVDTSCTNGGGNQPGGQQPTCTGGGLDQQSENQNPAGHAPGGHN